MSSTAAWMAQLREALLRGGYNEAEVSEHLDVAELGSPKPDQLPLMVRRTRGDDARSALIRAFFLRLPVPASHLAAAVAPASLEDLAAAKLVESVAGGIRGALRIVPAGRLWILADSHQLGVAPAQDFVMGIGTSTRLVYECTPQTRLGTALDLGSGSGFLAFSIAGRCRTVTAVDVNPRAIWMAKLGAELNSVGNLEALEGSWFEPVANRGFDLIVSNPPFIISPERRYTFRDAGYDGDSVCRMILREAAAHLNEGGIAVIALNWANLRDLPWTERIKAWIEGCGCDAWVLAGETLPVSAYAAAWIPAWEEAGTSCQELYDHWLDYYAAQQFESITMGIAILRRRRGENWFRGDDAPPENPVGCGGHVLMMLELLDFLESRTDRQLLEVRFRLASCLHLLQRSERGPERWEVLQAELQLQRGFRYVAGLDRYVLGLVSRLDGRQTAGEAIRALAHAMGADAEKVTPACLRMLRGLTARGFVLPEGIREPE